MRTRPIDLAKMRVLPLAQRKSLTRIEDILVDPAAAPPRCTDAQAAGVQDCCARIVAARQRDASVILMYGAHLLRNGAALVLERMMRHGWITHLATNGAGTIHDWEYSFLGRSTESVEENVATGTFGTWDETGRNIQLALLAGGVRDTLSGGMGERGGADILSAPTTLQDADRMSAPLSMGEGYGRALGRFIWEDGASLPAIDDLLQLIRTQPHHPLTAARADLLQALHQHGLASGRVRVEHPWKHGSILAHAFRHNVPMTVHPGIGYDIITNHPLFNGGVVGRAAQWDFQWLGGSVDRLDGGVVLAVGSAIMAPQVFEKNLSCVNNLRQQAGKPIVKDHTIYVVDLQDGGNWDWSQGEPPKTNPAYYLRFCKSFSRMGGAMRYVQSDNMVFLRNLWHELECVQPPASPLP